MAELLDMSEGEGQIIDWRVNGDLCLSAQLLPYHNKAKRSLHRRWRCVDLISHSVLSSLLTTPAFSICPSWFQMWRWWCPLSKNKQIKGNQMLTNSYYNTISNVTPNICKKKEPWVAQQISGLQLCNIFSMMMEAVKFSPHQKGQ